MAWMTQLLTENPELAVYLALGTGFWVGNVKLRGFNLGGATGSLLAGTAIGALVKVPATSFAGGLVSGALTESRAYHLDAGGPVIGRNVSS